MKTEPEIIIHEAQQISPKGGRHWFPSVSIFADGSLYQTDHTADDSAEGVSAEDSGSGRFSYDQGATWVEAPRGLRGGSPLMLKNGAIRTFSYPIWQSEDGGLYGTYTDLNKKRTAWSAEQPYYIDMPKVKRWKDDLVYVVFSRSVFYEPDGTILGTGYGYFEGDEKYRSFVLRSEDDGLNWTCISTIAYDAAIPGEGYCEPVLVRLADGSHLAVMRTGSGDGFPMAQCTSTDGCSSWSEPRNLGVFSVYPDLCLMQNGILVCSFGRPTVELMFNLDGRGENWSEPRMVFNGNSTCYTGLREISPNCLLLAYDQNTQGSPWEADDNCIQAVFIELKLQG